MNSRVFYNISDTWYFKNTIEKPTLHKFPNKSISFQLDHMLLVSEVQVTSAQFLKELQYTVQSEICH